MVQATDKARLKPAKGTSKGLADGPARSQASTQDLTELVDALRDVVLTARRRSAGSMHDKAVVALLSRLADLGPVRATELAERVWLDPSTISRHLRTLEEQGHVVRAPDPDDGRATLLAVTKSGRRLVDQAREQRLEQFATALKDWSDADRTDLIRLTRRLADSLEHS